MQARHREGIPAVVLAVCLVAGDAWSMGHAYEGQPVSEGLGPVAVALLVGLLAAVWVWLALGRYVD